MVLFHGFPQTYYMRRHVARRLDGSQLGLDTAAPWRTGALDVTRQATASGHFVNARCYTSETERRSVLDSGSTTTTNTARTLLGNDAERLSTLHRLDAFTAVTVPERSRL